MDGHKGSTGLGGRGAKRYSPERIGIWNTMTDASWRKYEKTFKDFCSLTYKDHSSPPTREQFLDFFVARRELKYCGNTLWSQFSHLNKVC